MSGTGPWYAPTRVLCDARYEPGVYGLVRSAYARATRCPVPTERTGRAGHVIGGAGPSTRGASGAEARGGGEGARAGEGRGSEQARAGDRSAPRCC
eukprot:1769994-Rhodomonas_salina.3